MATNEILPFASTNTGTNLLTQAEYTSDAQRTIGHQPGIARSKLENKALRQASIMASGLAQFIASYQSQNVTDSLTNAQIAEYLYNAIQGIIVIPDQVPAGSIMYVSRNLPPSGYLKANGAAVSRTTYSALFAAIGTTYGAGDGSTTFNLPDLRGEFLRGLDDGRGVDPSRGLGTAQSGMVESHTHVATTGNLAGVGFASGGNNLPRETNNTTNTAAYGGAETRPRNVALLACIKF